LMWLPSSRPTAAERMNRSQQKRSFLYARLTFHVCRKFVLLENFIRSGFVCPDRIVALHANRNVRFGPLGGASASIQHRRGLARSRWAALPIRKGPLRMKLEPVATRSQHSRRPQNERPPSTERWHVSWIACTLIDSAAAGQGQTLFTRLAQ
jgi:hypothetical protein